MDLTEELSGKKFYASMNTENPDWNFQKYELDSYKSEFPKLQLANMKLDAKLEAMQGEKNIVVEQTVIQEGHIKTAESVMQKLSEQIEKLKAEKLAAEE